MQNITAEQKKSFIVSFGQTIRECCRKNTTYFTKEEAATEFQRIAVSFEARVRRLEHLSERTLRKSFEEICFEFGFKTFLEVKNNDPVYDLWMTCFLNYHRWHEFMVRKSNYPLGLKEVSDVEHTKI